MPGKEKRVIEIEWEETTRGPEAGAQGLGCCAIYMLCNHTMKRKEMKKKVISKLSSPCCSTLSSLAYR
jgi:hypothetical protein